jgi:thioredoxin 1
MTVAQDVLSGQTLAFERRAMPFDPVYRDDVPAREDVDQTAGLLVVEFGAGWCGHCQALSPTLEAALQKYPEIQHLRVADGPGRKMGRSFRVKLWPTLILMRDGQVVSQLVRPTSTEALRGIEQLVDQAAT